jgi:hypothetical protein
VNVVKLGEGVDGGVVPGTRRRLSSEGVATKTKTNIKGRLAWVAEYGEMRRFVCSQVEETRLQEVLKMIAVNR